MKSNERRIHLTSFKDMIKIGPGLWVTGFTWIILTALMANPGQGATHHTKNLTCYFCHTLTNGPLCQNVFRNNQMVQDLPSRQCANEDKHCIVRRFAYAPNGTDTKIWMMERNCSRQCTSECVITGDRMKLHLCTSCCQKDLCNFDNSASSMLFAYHHSQYVTFLFIAALVAVFLANFPSTDSFFK